jgi:hypothetical protein
MRYPRYRKVVWSTAAVVTAAVTLCFPGTSHAGLLTVTENLPTSGFTQSFTLGAGANVPLSAGQSYSYSTPGFKTPDGQFEIFINNISAADPSGFPSLAGSLSVVNLAGGTASLFMDYKQFFVPNAIFNNGCFDGAALVGSFTESAMHGNNVVGVGIIGGQALPPISATDFGGAKFNVNTGFFFLPSPTKFEGQVTFNFSATSAKNDEITLPFTILSPSLSSVPEPSTLLMASSAVLAGLSCSRFRRRHAGT